MEKIGGKFIDMSAREWVDYELARQEKWVEEFDEMPYEEFVEKRDRLTAHMAKAQVLRTIQKKLDREVK